MHAVCAAWHNTEQKHTACAYLASDRSCSLIRWIHSSSCGARYDVRYSRRSLLKQVGDSPALALLPSGNRGNKGLIHILGRTESIERQFHHHNLSLGVRLSPLRLLVPVGSDEVGGQDNDPEAFLIPQQHHLPVQTGFGFSAGPESMM